MNSDLNFRFCDLKNFEGTRGEKNQMFRTMVINAP